MKVRKWVGGTLLIVSLSATSQIKAALIASDNFDADTSGVTINTQGNGTGFSSNWYSDQPSANTVGTPSLNYTSGAVSDSSSGNKSLQFAANTATGGSTSVDNGAAERTYSAPASASTVYFSYLISANQATTSNSGAFVEIGLSNTAANTGAEPALSVGIALSGSSLAFYARPKAAGASDFSSVTFNANQTYLVVGKASAVSSADYNTLSLFVDPTTATEPAPTLTAPTTDSGISSVSSFDARLAQFGTGDLYTIDQVNIGSTWADVVPTPEPTALALVALAGAGLLSRRARR